MKDYIMKLLIKTILILATIFTTIGLLSASLTGYFLSKNMGWKF